MSQYVIDTHTLIWHLTATPHLSEKVEKILAEADAGLHRIYVPTIVLVEILYLTEKRRFPENLLNQTLALLQIPNGSYASAPLEIEIVWALQRIPRTLVPEMPDRIIAATALYLDLPLLSKDPVFNHISDLQVIW